MGARPSALFLSPEAPYPVIGGGALRSASLLEFLARHYETDVIVFRQPGADPPSRAFPPGIVREIIEIPLPVHSRTPVARALRNVRRAWRGIPPLVDRFSGFEESISGQLQGHHYQWAMVEHFWAAPYAAVLRAHAEQLILDLHNIESRLHERTAQAAGGFESWLSHHFARSNRQWEQEWLPQFDHLVATSPEDAAWLEASVPGSRVHVYPNALPWCPLPSEPKDHSIVFTGNLEYVPNIQAVRYFRTAIWPSLRKRWPNLVWRLIGRNPHAVQRYLQGDPRIELVGPVEDAIPWIARSQAAVVPLRSGSGTRFKILEAWMAGTPVVSTTLGAEGLPGVDGVHLLLADASDEFTASVSSLLERPELGRQLATAGRALYERSLTWEAAWKSLSWLSV